MTGSDKYELDDWVLHESHVKQITAVETDGRVIDVSDGMFTHGGHDLRENMRPLTRRNLRISANYDYRRKQIEEAEAGANANWPDIHNKLIDLWLAEIDAKGEKASEKAYHEAENWVREICDALTNARKGKVGGVMLFRPVVKGGYRR